MFWDNFYNACLKKGIKPNSLAKELSIASGSMTSWKNGKTPNGETLLKIADYLDVSVDYLLGREINSGNYSGNHISGGNVNMGGNNVSMNESNITVSKDAIEIDHILQLLDFEKRAELMGIICKYKRQIG